MIFVYISDTSSSHQTIPATERLMTFPMNRTDDRKNANIPPTLPHSGYVCQVYMRVPAIGW